ncbi:MAG: hypothetical protein ACOCXH_00740 [Cyclobacteriaceae bacterium]
MKELIKYFCIIIIIAGFSFSCLDPMEDRQDMNFNDNSVQIDYQVQQKNGHDNVIYLQSNTPAVIPFWDYQLGVSNKEKDTINIPFEGDWTIKYYAYTKNGPRVDSSKIKVTENDPVIFSDPAWELISNMMDGKKWVLAREGTCWGTGPTDSPEPTWWQVTFQNMLDWRADGDEAYWPAEDTIYFDLNRGYNFKRLHKDGTVTNGIWNYNPATENIILQGTMLPLHSEREIEGEPVYHVAKLTEDEMALHIVLDWGVWGWVYNKAE